MNMHEDRGNRIIASSDELDPHPLKEPAQGGNIKMPQMIRDIPGAIITPEHLLLQTIRVGNGDIKKCRIILDKFSEESRRICDVFQNMPQNNRTPLACPLSESA